MVVTPDYDYAKINHSKSERTRSPSDGSLVGTRNLNLLEAKKGDELSPRSAFLKNPRPETVETTENTMEHAKPEEQVHHMVSNYEIFRYCFPNFSEIWFFKFSSSKVFFCHLCPASNILVICL